MGGRILGNSMAQNPFRALGLSPLAFAGKSDMQIRKLVKLVGRAMVQTEHPDAGGNEARFKELQNALAELEDDEKFSKAKEQFLQTSQKRADQVERLLAVRTQLLRSAREQFRSYLLSLASRVDAPTVIRPGSVVLSMSDTFKNRNPGFSPGVPPHTLCISERGRVVEVRGPRRKATPRVLVGTVTGEKVFASSRTIYKLMEKCQGNTTPSARPQIPSRITTIMSRQAQVGHTAPFAHAAAIINLLAPGIEKHSFLFSLYHSEDEPLLYCEGKIISIETQADPPHS